jgi:hypothetical protein
MSKNIVTNKGFRIRPCDINIDHKKGFEHLWDSFGNSETEVSAYFIVKLCQELGGWVPFTLSQIEAVYQKGGQHDGYLFNRLVDPRQKVSNAAAVFGGELPQTEPVGGGWVALGADDKYYVTYDFVTRCFQSSPAQP